MPTKKAAATLEDVATATSTKQWNIPRPAMHTLRVPIMGITPLITSRFGELATDSIVKGQAGGAKIKKAARDPEAEFRDALYVVDGKYCFPTIGIKKAMVSAGQRFADERGTELWGAFTMLQQWAEIETDAPPAMRTDRVILSGMSRTTSLAYRPMFERWGMTLLIQYNSLFIPGEQVLNLLELAGRSVGIGAWRVEKKGNFGTFGVDFDNINLVEERKG